MGSPSGGVGGGSSSDGASRSGSSNDSSSSDRGSSSSESRGSDFGGSVSAAESSRDPGSSRPSDSRENDDRHDRDRSSPPSTSSSDSGLTASQSDALAESAGVIDGYALTSVDDEPPAEDDEANAAVVGRSAARARDNYVNAQTQQVVEYASNAPLTAYEGDVYRHVPTDYASTYNNAEFSSPGRYNRTGESTLYTSESLHGLELEASRYPSETDPSGLADRTVTRSEFSGQILDATSLPGIAAGALTEGYGLNGQERSRLSRITGEDPYTHTRALNDAARVAGAGAVRVPAGDDAVHIGILTENLSDPAVQFQYRDHFDVDANGMRGPVVSSPGSIETPPAASTPNIHDPTSLRHDSARTADVYAADAIAHSRATGVRYGAAGGGLVSGIQALSDGELTRDDATQVATNTGVGAAAAYADDVIAPGVGTVRAGGIVDGVISAGTSVYSNAQAYERGEISAADATADVVVDTGVGVASGLAGAAAGAAIGSVVPVAGTAVGAAIGFGVGMLASWGASTVLEESGAADWAREGLGDALEDNVSEGVLKGAWNRVSGWFGG